MAADFPRDLIPPALTALAAEEGMAAIAMAATIGRVPVAKATTVRTSARPAVTSATRRETPDGPAEPEAATTASLRVSVWP